VATASTTIGLELRRRPLIEQGRDLLRVQLWSAIFDSSIAPTSTPALAHLTRIGYGSPERKEVMCSDRQYA
jgi:hypothetical protein